MSHKFGMTWKWVNDDRFYFWVNYFFNKKKQSWLFNLNYEQINLQIIYENLCLDFIFFIQIR